MKRALSWPYGYDNKKTGNISAQHHSLSRFNIKVKQKKVNTITTFAKSLELASMGLILKLFDYTTTWENPKNQFITKKENSILNKKELFH